MKKQLPGGKIRIAIVDDHPMLRRGVRETIFEATDFELVGVGESAADAIKMAHEGGLDLMVLDIALPGGGIEAVKEISKSHPNIKLVMLTVREDLATVRAALKAGARGYLVKGVDGPELMGTLRSIVAGQNYVTPALAAQLLTETDRSAPVYPSPAARLTEREKQIIMLLGEGQSNQEIADTLGLAENTIKHYMTPLLQKLGARNRTEAALIARTGSATRKK